MESLNIIQTVVQCIYVVQCIIHLCLLCYDYQCIFSVMWEYFHYLLVHAKQNEFNYKLSILNNRRSAFSRPTEIRGIEV